MTAAIETHQLSKYYGNILGLNEISLEIQPGITGLLGPNGAGKSTLMKILTGQLRPSLGRALIWGEKIWNNFALFDRIGYCPEHDSFYEQTTGWQFLTGLLRLFPFSSAEAEERAERALDTVELLADKDRLIRGYSRGMRQRLKVAQALAHEPDLLILDEPLNGLDPLGKRKIIRLIKDLKNERRTVLVSSHVLPEVEALTKDIILIHQGKILASGEIHTLRDLIDSHPHIIALRCERPRQLAARLVAEPYVLKVQMGGQPDGLIVETNNRDRFFSLLPELVTDMGLAVAEITSPDDNLQAVFDYLVGK
ncbi:MAG: ABC transporter ATP-binding protein [Candidatus Aminicenantes bacterium]|nr:ABC transporter ATP-binding protein [Candidatus Aminicenantes bacterium]